MWGQDNRKLVLRKDYCEDYCGGPRRWRAGGWSRLLDVGQDDRKLACLRTTASRWRSSKMVSRWLEQVAGCGVRLNATLCLLEDDCKLVQVLEDGEQAAGVSDWMWGQDDSEFSY